MKKENKSHVEIEFPVDPSGTLITRIMPIGSFCLRRAVSFNSVGEKQEQFSIVLADDSLRVITEKEYTRLRKLLAGGK
jgi:hypothetical protein